MEKGACCEQDLQGDLEPRKELLCVVSELAKNHRGGKKSRACVATGILGASLLVPMGTNWAAPAVNPAGEGPGIAIGTGLQPVKRLQWPLGAMEKRKEIMPWPWVRTTQPKPIILWL